MQKSKFPRNEGKCCDAVLKYLEKRMCVTRSALAFPEKEPHEAPVELICKIGSTRYAVEHTKIEAYPGQMEDGTHFTNALEHLETALANHLPAHAYFRLVVPVNSFKGITKKEAKAIGEKIKKWIVCKAPLLKPTGHKMDWLSEVIDGVPFKVTLQAANIHQDLNGKLRIARFSPDDSELVALRNNQMQKALNNKLPKLRWWANEGAHTILILESDDIALTNQVVVFEALRINLPAQSFWPDYVFYVGTTGSTWIIHPLIIDRQFSEFPYPWPYLEFNADDLSDILLH